MIPKIILLILLPLLFDKIIYSTAYYNVKLKGFDHFEEIKNPSIIVNDIKLKKFNKTHYVVDGVFTVLRDNINRENYKVSVHGAQKKSNGYQDTSLVRVEKISACDQWENEKVFIPGIKNSINDSTVICPIKKGTYALVNYMPDISHIPPNVPGGAWRISFMYYDGDELIAGWKIYMELTSLTDKLT